jgi:hypothetical protein
MTAIAELAPPERAAIALADLARAGPDGVGVALGLDGDRAAKLLHRAREGFAARLGVPRPQADEAARSWLWAAPPEEIWQALYPQFHRAVERALRRGPLDHTLVLGPADGPAKSPAPPGRRRRGGGRVRRPRWGRRPRWTLILSTIGVLSLGGIAGVRVMGANSHTSRDGSGSEVKTLASPPGSAPDALATPPTGASSVKTHKPLTPAELDKLRLRELNQLNDYTRSQADRRLSTAKRQAAARGIDSLQRAADRRLQAELKREQVLRDQLARERAKRNAPPPPSAPRPTTKPVPRTQTPKRQTTSPSNPPRNKADANQSCLLDQDSGQYICPQ